MTMTTRYRRPPAAAVDILSILLLIADAFTARLSEPVVYCSRLYARLLGFVHMNFKERSPKVTSMQPHYFLLISHLVYS